MQNVFSLNGTANQFSYGYMNDFLTYLCLFDQISNGFYV